MKKLFLLIGIILGFTGCQRGSKIGISVLTPSQIEEAIEYGKKNAFQTFTEFTEKWSIFYKYEQGKGKAIIITPFLRVALISKNAAEKNQRIDMKIINLALRDISDKLCFRVTLYGGYPTFGKTAKFFLEYNNKKFQPISFYMSAYSQMTRDYDHISEGEVKFFKNGIPENAKIKLVAIFKPFENDKETSCIFEFDLSKYK